MNTLRAWFCLFAAIAIGPLSALAESGAYGFRLYQVDWKEKKLYGEEPVSEDGVAFGPSFLFRLGGGDNLGLGLDGYYLSAGDLERSEIDGRLLYTLSEVFDVSLELRHTRNDVTFGSGGNSREVGTRGTGPGAGLHFQAPLGDSGLIAFGTTRGYAMSMSTDVEEVDDRWTFLWLYEFGLAFASRIELGVADSSIYVAAGYRHQQNRGGEFDETVEMPFLEFGLRQEF